MAREFAILLTKTDTGASFSFLRSNTVNLAVPASQENRDWIIERPEA